MAASPSYTDYFTYPYHVYRADKSFEATVIVDTGSHAGNFISDRLISKVISLDCKQFPSDLRLCSCIGNCTTCRTSFLFDLKITIPLRETPIVIRNQIFHVLKGLPAEILLGAKTIHDSRILEQLISSTAPRVRDIDPELVMRIKQFTQVVDYTEIDQTVTGMLTPGQEITLGHDGTATPQDIYADTKPYIEGKDMDLEDHTECTPTDLLNPPENEEEASMHTGRYRDPTYREPDYPNTDRTIDRDDDSETVESDSEPEDEGYYPHSGYIIKNMLHGQQHNDNLCAATIAHISELIDYEPEIVDSERYDFLD